VPLGLVWTVPRVSDREQARERITHVIARLEPIARKVCRLLEEAEEDPIAFYAFPRVTRGLAGGVPRLHLGRPVTEGSANAAGPTQYLEDIGRSVLSCRPAYDRGSLASLHALRSLNAPTVYSL
jgi:hypothetical protein